jgi:hypothetical protein
VVVTCGLKTCNFPQYEQMKFLIPKNVPSFLKPSIRILLKVIQHRHFCQHRSKLLMHDLSLMDQILPPLASEKHNLLPQCMILLRRYKKMEPDQIIWK